MVKVQYIYRGEKGKEEREKGKRVIYINIREERKEEKGERREKGRKREREREREGGREGERSEMKQGVKVRERLTRMSVVGSEVRVTASSWVMLG